MIKSPLEVSSRTAAQNWIAVCTMKTTAEKELKNLSMVGLGKQNEQAYKAANHEYAEECDTCPATTLAKFPD